MPSLLISMALLIICYLSQVIYQAFSPPADHLVVFTQLIGHYNSQIRIKTQLFKTPMVCVLILPMSGGTYCLKPTPNGRLFEKICTYVCVKINSNAKILYILTAQHLTLTEHCQLYNSIHFHQPTCLGANFGKYFRSMGTIPYEKEDVKAS